MRDLKTVQRAEPCRLALLLRDAEPSVTLKANARDGPEKRKCLTVTYNTLKAEHHTVRPPSTGNSMPVMKEPSSEAR